ncbi:hypothetical protein PEDI_38170 [Persicobacter diffluens]|uniref:Uncharacterized protein n=1 Tax=Persicobacter diffluens TaxID=981 RepID=A0AAN5AKW1_9BACT|nr:hypothetical protein PEDI_38170 [Persicobacter diffluens]
MKRKVLQDIKETTFEQISTELLFFLLQVFAFKVVNLFPVQALIQIQVFVPIACAIPYFTFKLLRKGSLPPIGNNWYKWSIVILLATLLHFWINIVIYQSSPYEFSGLYYLLLLHPISMIGVIFIQKLFSIFSFKNP